MADAFICFGDYISLYCEDTSGFVYSDQTSAAYNGLFVYQDQDREKPNCIPNIHAITYQIVSQNRYKLEKKYRTLINEHGSDVSDLEIKDALKQAKLAAKAEEEDNGAEQARLKGQRLRYGQLVQLRHFFTNKYIHTSSTDTSVVDKNKMVVQLQPYNAKHAQFKLMPRFKVKTEGELVEVNDRIILESVKSPGTYLHASLPYRINHVTVGSELNLGVDITTFTILKNQRPNISEESYLKAGSTISLFHKELEAWLAVEGVFDEPTTEDVHLRVRPVSQLELRTLYNPKSGIVYWQVESVESILSGQNVKWVDHIRLRHMTTRLYLSLSSAGEVILTDDADDPKTVYTIHSMHVGPTHPVITFNDNVRIQHLLTGWWLHASLNDMYRSRACDNEKGAMAQLRRNKSQLVQIKCSERQQYRDAFTLQKVEYNDVKDFNYVAGMVPFIRDLIMDRKANIKWSAKRCNNICSALKELRDFIVVDDIPIKNRQKLLRNLKVVDLLVTLLECGGAPDMPDCENICAVYQVCYSVLHSYTKGRSKKNALYFAKYFDTFKTELGAQNGVGLHCCVMLTDLIKDNRQIVDRISPEDISLIIQILQDNKHYRYLELLGVLCVCNEIAITENQTFIANNLLAKHKSFMCHIELGQDIQLQKDIVYVSADNRKTWHALYKFVYKSNPEYCEDEYLFLEGQLDLYIHLCYGRNEVAIKTVTRNREFFTWAVAFKGLESEILPDKMRARFCDLIIGLFVDVGDNYSIIELSSNNFVYEEIDATNPDREDANHVPKQLESHFPALRLWLEDFFLYNSRLYASTPNRNLLIKEVLRLVTNLVQYGYLGSKEDMQDLMKPVLNYVDGSNDAPFPPDKGDKYSAKDSRLVAKYRKKDRYKPGEETDAIVEAKIQGLQLLELIMVKTFNKRVKYLVSTFKGTILPSYKVTTTQRKLRLLIEDGFRTETFWRKKILRLEVEKLLNNLMKSTDLLNKDLPGILFDLTNYDSDKMVTRSLAILRNFYASRESLFLVAVDAQILSSTESKRVHREALLSMMELRRLARCKMDQAGLEKMCEYLHDYKEACHVPHQPELAHPIGQKILTNNGLWSILFSIVTQEVDQNLPERYNIGKKSISAALITMKYLIQSNTTVQTWAFNCLQKLLQIEICGSELGEVLAEIFRYNPVKSLQVAVQHVQRVVQLAGKHQHMAPEMLQVLKVLVKDETTGMVLQRNQTLVVKYIMENYKTAAYVMDMPWERRLEILIGKDGNSHQEYLIALVDLLASCAQGSSRYIESLCQTLLSVDEIICILNNRNIDMAYKTCYGRYLTWGYMRTARTKIESGMETFCHDSNIWKHIQILWTLMRKCIQQDNNTPVEDDYKNSTMSLMSSTLLSATGIPIHVDPADLSHYMLNAGFLFLLTFFHKFYKPDPEVNPEEIKVLRRLVIVLTPFAAIAAKYITTAAQHSHVKECLEMLSKKAQGYVNAQALSKFHEICKLNEVLTEKGKETSMAKRKVYLDEDEDHMNHQLNMFCKNLESYIHGINSVAFQLGTKHHHHKSIAYVGEDMDVKLPLGIEFQKHVTCFMNNDSKDPKKRYEKAQKLIKQLAISNKLYREEAPESQELLDIRSLQILRAMMYNIIVILPDNWQDDVLAHKKTLQDISDVQMMFHDMSIVSKMLPLMSRRNPEISREIIAVVDLLLYNACNQLQNDLIEYFLSTTEERFFIFINDRLAIASTVIKERRSVEMQQKHIQKMRANIEEKKKQKQESEEIKTQQQAKNKFDRRARRRSHLQPFLRWKLADRLLVLVDHHEMKDMEEDDGDAILTSSLAVPGADKGQELLNLNKDSGDINIVIRVLARVCDGQNRDLQYYLQHQFDNIRSVDLVASVTQFISVVYAHITASSIDLLTQTFSTLNEMCQGNQKCRNIVLNNKIVDYLNYILRMGTIEDVPLQKVMELRLAMCQLTRSMIEENGPEAKRVAMDVRDTIDMPTLRRILATCFIFSMQTKGRAASLKILMEKYKQCVEDKNVYIEEIQDTDVPETFLDTASQVGFMTYFVLARFNDLDKSLEAKAKVDRCQWHAFKYYKTLSTSIEVLKDDHLQKVHFKICHQDLLREELRESVKWNIDRSSAMSKLRDLVFWSNDILKDINYQKTILKNPVAHQLATKWPVWNYACIVLSLIINIGMLVTWKSPYGIDDIPENATSLSAIAYEPKPLVTWPPYVFWLYVLGGIHNVCSFMLLLSYVMLKHPKLPDVFWLVKKIRKACRKTKDDDDDDDDDDDNLRETRVSKLEVKLLSGVSVYYMLMFVLSLGGSVFEGYLFAFHLFNIVANNQLLKGVVRAVTQNGLSLLWVGIMGLVLIYVYGLIGFAFFRPLFDPNNDMAAYCGTLMECVVTVFRYGTLGDIGEAFGLHPLDRSFFRFIMLTVYQVTFFILFTTIGLNIIFGIIVDTFSELRDLKWAAERDMREICFICSRDSYDFEQSGRGFKYHVKNEHNMWAYVFYFIHLHETNDNDYSAIDLYVANLLKKERLDFFPLNQAMCLEEGKENTVEDKLEEIMEALGKVHEFQQQQVSVKVIKTERAKQDKWADGMRKASRIAFKTPSRGSPTPFLLSGFTGTSSPRPPPVSIQLRGPPNIQDSISEKDEDEATVSSEGKDGDTKPRSSTPKDESDA